VSDEGLPDDRMQSLAAQTNYSEKTFVTPRVEGNGGYAVRIFTPAREIAFDRGNNTNLRSKSP
jgi:PhzF family phenazine biosynthesis protein